MLSKKQWEALNLLENDPVVSTILYGGAAGGGKSFLGNFWQISRRVWHPDTSGLIGRDSLVNLKKTTLVTFFRIWTRYFQNNPHGVTIRPDGQTNTIHFSNGSVIYLKGLSHNSSDPEGTDFGSLELTDAFIDEVNNCSKKYVDIVESRIRHNLVKDKSPILLAANPGYDWVRSRFIKDKDGNVIVLHPHERIVRALLSDNPDEKFKENYRRQLEKLPPYDRQRLLDGDWDAVEKPENPFLYDWNNDIHISDRAVFNTNLPLILSMDFNVNPLCGGFAQVHNRKVSVLNQIHIEGGSIAKLCTTVQNYLNDLGIPASRLIVTGDRNGSAQKIGQFDNKSSYIQIKEALNLRDTQFILPGNPLHKNSRADCNKVLRTWDVMVNPVCIGLIADAQTVNCNHDGAIIKSNRNIDSQRADHLDWFRYLVNSFCKK